MGFLVAFVLSIGLKWDGFDAEMLMGFEEIDMDDDIREEYPCPFCSDYFDIVGLCCHIDDEHPVEAKNGVSVSPIISLYNYGQKLRHCSGLFGMSLWILLAFLSRNLSH